jgi:hypothetical protein
MSDNLRVRLSFLMLVLLPACFLIFVTCRYLKEEWMVDRCLSAHHGSFDYSNMTCDLETNHPYVSYEARHTLDEWGATVALVCFFLFLLGYFHKGANWKIGTSK